MDVIDGKMAAPIFFTASEICGDAIMGPTFSRALSEFSFALSCGCNEARVSHGTDILFLK